MSKKDIQSYASGTPKSKFGNSVIWIIITNYRNCDTEIRSCIRLAKDTSCKLRKVLTPETKKSIGLLRDVSSPRWQ